MTGRGPRITASYACPVCRESDGIGLCHDPDEHPMGDEWECVGRTVFNVECCGRLIAREIQTIGAHGPATGAAPAQVHLAAHLAETHGYAVDPVALHVDGPTYGARP